MILQHHNRLSFFRFPHLAEFPDIRHGIFTRQGGFSQGCFCSLNVGKGIGDPIDHVLRNRQAIADCMGQTELIFANQIHGTTIVAPEDCFVPISGSSSHAAPSADAMISAVPGKALVIQTADCQAVLMYDPVRKAVANVHSGWRGSIQNIVGLTVQAMIKRFGSDPKDIVAGIGPSLGPCCAEFIHYRTEIPKTFWPYKNASDCFDFWRLSQDQLMDAGVPGNHILSGNLCTRCRTDIFFSYRKEKTTGRFAAVIGLS